MMPDLGKYAAIVLSAYGITLLLLGLLVAQTFLGGRKVRRDLRAAETRAKAEGGK